VLGFKRPLKNASHRVKEVACLVRCLLSALAAGNDRRGRDPGDLLRSGRLNNLPKDISRCRLVAADSAAHTMVSR
jgi:hypothetical protein